MRYLTSWNELEKTSWETEEDLEQYGNIVKRCWASNPKQVGGENMKYQAYCVQTAKRSQARSAGKIHVPPGHKLSCDSRCGPYMYSPDIIGSYIFFTAAGDGWQFAKVVGLAEDAESVMFPHTIKMLDWGKLFNVHLRRERLKMPDVSGDPRTWCFLAEVASITNTRCLDVNVDDYGLVAPHRSHVLGNIYYVGAFWQSWCRSLIERAQFAWSRFVVGTATMTT